MKKIFTFGAIIIGFFLLAVSGIYLTAVLQRVQDYKTILSFAATATELRATGNEKPIKGSHACIPDKKAGRCPALFYEVSDQSCKTLMKAYDINKENCAATKKVVHNGREIEIHFGQSYEHPNSNLQITMNETNLLWQFY